MNSSQFFEKFRKRSSYHHLFEAKSRLNLLIQVAFLIVYYTIPRTNRELQHAFSILFILLDYTIPGAIREALLKVNRIFKYFKYILSQYKLPHCLQMAAAPGHKKIRLESLSAVRGGYFISSRRREVYEKKQKQVPAVSSAGQAQEFSGHYVSAAKVYVGIL